MQKLKDAKQKTGQKLRDAKQKTGEKLTNAKQKVLAPIKRKWFDVGQKICWALILKCHAFTLLFISFIIRDSHDSYYMYPGCDYAHCVFFHMAFIFAFLSMILALVQWAQFNLPKNNPESTVDQKVGLKDKFRLFIAKHRKIFMCGKGRIPKYGLVTCVMTSFCLALTIWVMYADVCLHWYTGFLVDICVAQDTICAVTYSFCMCCFLSGGIMGHKASKDVKSSEGREPTRWWFAKKKSSD